MKETIPVQTFILTAWTVSLFTPLSARAQPNFFQMPPPPGEVGETNRPPLLNVMLDTSYIGDTKAEYQGTKLDKSDAYNLSLGVNGMIPLNAHWIVPVEMMSANDWLESVSGAPVPAHINTLSLGTGIGYPASDKWMFMARVALTLYRFSDVKGDDIGVSGGLMAMWNYSPTLQFMFGVMVDPDSDLKALPMAGVNWIINDQWDLHLMFPQPRLIYNLDDHWNLYAGANISGGTFRTSEALGSEIGQPRYNNALGTYRDIRLGVGAAYKVTRSIRLEAETGYSVSRQIDYTRISETVRFEPAPYVRVRINLGF